MNIYDEALEEIEDTMYESMNTVQLPKTIKALERAKKLEELLRLHKYYTDYNLFPSKVVERMKELEEEMK